MVTFLTSLVGISTTSFFFLRSYFLVAFSMSGRLRVLITMVAVGRCIKSDSLVAFLPVLPNEPLDVLASGYSMSSIDGMGLRTCLLAPDDLPSSSDPRC